MQTRRTSKCCSKIVFGGDFCFFAVLIFSLPIQPLFNMLNTNDFITARRNYASAVLGVVILSVCLSVCPTVCHTRALWLIQRTYRWYFYTAWKGNPFSFLPSNSGWWATSSSTFNGRSKWPTPFKNRSRRQISACNVSTVRTSEKKVQLWRIWSRTRAFQRAVDEMRTLHRSLPKGGSKSELFLFWNKSQLQLNVVCCKVSLRENFQQQSCSTLIPLSNGT